jgi:hypothetical protein
VVFQIRSESKSMSPNELIAAIITVLGIVGAGVKWLLTHLASNAASAALKESEARAQLSERLHDEIRVLRMELAEIHVEKKLYLRRIFQLERFIHTQPGINIPEMEGWPPT